MIALITYKKTLVILLQAVLSATFDTTWTGIFESSWHDHFIEVFKMRVNVTIEVCSHKKAMQRDKGTAQDMHLVCTDDRDIEFSGC